MIWYESRYFISCYSIIIFCPIFDNILMSNIKKLLGNRIREIRRSKNLTQEKLAELVGIGTPNISYIETGKYAPSMDTLEKIAEVLEVKPFELYMFEPLKPANELREELITAMDDENLLKLLYKFYLTIK